MGLGVKWGDELKCFEILRAGPQKGDEGIARIECQDVQQKNGKSDMRTTFPYMLKVFPLPVCP
jgi:hypothetical protein